MKKEYLYRYEEVTYSLGLDQFDDPIRGYKMQIELKEFEILRRTPKGVWIKKYNFCLDNNNNKKFVLLTANKKFACETKEQALRSFMARKRRQVKILESQLERAKHAFRLAEVIEGTRKHENSYGGR